MRPYSFIKTLSVHILVRWMHIFGGIGFFDWAIKVSLGPTSQTDHLSFSNSPSRPRFKVPPPIAYFVCRVGVPHAAQFIGDAPKTLFPTLFYSSCREFLSRLWILGLLRNFYGIEIRKTSKDWTESLEFWKELGILLNFLTRWPRCITYLNLHAHSLNLKLKFEIKNICFVYWKSK